MPSIGEDVHIIADPEAEMNPSTHSHFHFLPFLLAYVRRMSPFKEVLSFH